MPKKSLGQNYLNDHNIAKKIINLITYKNNEINIIEIGPGNGFLTEYLIKKKPKKLILIEKDSSLFVKLKNKYIKHKNIIIYNEDAIKTNIIQKIKKPKIIVSNLPYNISIKLIMNWLLQINDYISLHLMIQKEVAEKFEYKDSLKLNRLNLFMHLMCNYKKEFNVSPNVFYPKPKVHSSVITLKPEVKENIDLIKFQNYTRFLFSKKRKKISTIIKKHKNYVVNQEKIYNSNIILSKRPEDLRFKEALNLFKILY